MPRKKNWKMARQKSVQQFKAEPYPKRTRQKDHEVLSGIKDPKPTEEPKAIEKPEPKPIKKPEPKPIKKPEPKPIKKPEPKPIRKPETKPIRKPETKPFNERKPNQESIKKSILEQNKTTRERTYTHMNEIIHESMKNTINDTIKEAMNKPTEQAFNKTLNQPIDENINQALTGTMNVTIYNTPRQIEKISFTRSIDKQSVQGKFHQGNAKYNGATPCVVNSLVSMVYSNTKPIHTWQATDLDTILDLGYDLYCKIQRSLKWAHPLLLISEIPNEFEIQNQKYSLSVTESYVGLVYEQSDEEMGVIMSLHKALEKSLYQSDFCFITFYNQTFSVIKSNTCYYRFDPHSRDDKGNQFYDGTSVLIQASTISEIHEQCLDLARSMRVPKNEQFEVTGASIDIMQTKSSVDQYNELNTDTEEGDTDVLIMHVEYHHQSNTFLPLPISTRNDICTNLNINNCVTPLKTNGSAQLTSPCKTQSIQGDGNCFFRAISHAISGTEKNHIRLRHLIVKHLRDKHVLFQKHIRRDFVSIDDYLEQTDMYYAGNWATEVEIHAAAHFLCTNIYTYTNQTWLQFSPSDIETNRQVHEGAIYLLHCHSHYEVVLCVKSSNYNLCNSCNPELNPNKTHMKRTRSKWTRTRNQSNIGPLKDHIQQNSTPQKDLESRSPTNRYREGKNAIRRSRYKNDKELREKIKTRIRQRYQINHIHRESVKTHILTKYKSDMPYRTKAIARAKSKYKTNPEHRNKTLIRAITKYMADPEHRAKVIKRGIAKYKTDPEHRKQVKTRDRRKYKTNPEHRKQVITRGITKYKTDPEHRKQVITRGITKYKTDPEHRKQVITRGITKYKTDPEHRKQVITRGVTKYNTDPEHRHKVITRNKTKYATDPLYKARTLRVCSTEKYRADPEFRNKIQKCNQNRREKNSKQYLYLQHVIMDFQQKTSHGPEYVCCVCQRLLFENQVTKCYVESFKRRGGNVEKLAMSAICHRFVHTCSASCKQNCPIMKSGSRSSLWICFTCQRKLLKGKMPSEASVNNLNPTHVPEELKSLNSLEQHLISLQIPFVKMVALPKGGQRAVQGPVICVPTDINKATSILPRYETDDQLIRIKLKRKLEYKGHYEYQFVQKSRLKKALSYLKQSNKWYENVAFNENWQNSFSETEQTQKRNRNAKIPTIENSENNSENHFNSSAQNTTDTDDELPDIDNAAFANSEDDQQNGILLDTCLQPVDIAQEVLDQYSEDVLCVAPAENNNPIQILRDESNEAKSFPVLFPTGQGTFYDNREHKITLSRYLHTRLMNVDNRFAKDISYIFHSQYRSEIHQVLSSISIALRKGSASINGNSITAQMLTNKDTLRNIIKADEGYRFLKPIRGTPQYWQSAQKDVFAMLRQLGIPTWFASFSSADMRWPEMVEIIMRQQGDVRKAIELDWTEKCDILKSNPVTVARMFEHRFNLFLNKVILSEAAPIGKIVDFFYRVEFQQRGSPHVHALFWVENAPKLDKDSDQDVVSFIDTYISCTLPNLDDKPELSRIVTEVQRHSSRHSKTCKKKGTECRFNFPRPPSNKTFIARPPDNNESNAENCSAFSPQQASNENNADFVMSADYAQNLLSNIRKALTSDKQYTSLHKLLKDKDLTEESYIQAFHLISKKANIILRREPKDIWINQYNPALLEAWDGNMDLQYVLDAYSCVVYIVSYLSKAEREMSLLLEHTQREMSKDGNPDAKAAMRKLGTVYLHNREVSAQEAVFRVCNLKLKQCSRKVQFIPVGENPVKMSLPLSVLQNRSQDKDLDNDGIWMTTLIDRYKHRPHDWEFEYMCLARFCSEYRVLYGSEAANESENRNTYKLGNDLGFIKKRTRSKPAVIRYPRFSPTCTPEKYYHSILQLFLPYRTEEQLKPTPFERYEDFYHSGAVMCIIVEPVQQIVDRNRTLFEIDADQIDRAHDNLEKCGPLEDAWALVCPETEHSRIECKTVRENEDNEQTENHNENNIPDLIMPAADKTTKERHVISITREEALPLMRSLNPQQAAIFYKVRQWCLDKTNGQKPEPFHVFVTGGAGTGKSHLIKSIYYECTRLLAPSMQKPEDTSVIITAPTGVAAFNIGASTIHSTFAIRPEAKLPYQPLGEDTLNTLRIKLEHVQIVIIDEISMVDHKMLVYIHGRLRQIKQTRHHSPFGNVSIVAVGDFHQLPPVKGTALYVEQPGVDLWSGRFAKAELNEIMRQKDDAHFAQLLNRMRTKDKKQPLSKDDLDFFKERESKEAPINCLYIFGTNAEVDEHNMQILHASCENPIHIESEDFTRDPRTGKFQKRETHHSHVYNTNLPKSITLGVGARVMLTKNIDISDGLVNGIFGTISGIVTSADSSFPSKIYVCFDKNNVGEKLRKTISTSKIPEYNTPIEPQEDKVNNKGGIRRQFPLKLAWACTVHKVQGLTVPNAVVSLKRVFSAGQAYVALSRVTSADGLFIQDFKEEYIYSNKKVDKVLSSMPEFLSPSPAQASTNIRILLHNVQGLTAHIKDIQTDTRFTDADVICVTETWLPECVNSTSVNITDFNFRHAPRTTCYNTINPICASLKNQAHGGVGMYVKRSRRFTRLNLNIDNIEMIAYLIYEFDLTLTVIHRPQSYPVAAFIKVLHQLIQQLAKLSNNSIVMGDFNQDILKKQLTIRQHMMNNNYVQIVETPTTEMGTLIDHVYIRGTLPISVSVLPTFYSFHETIELRL